VWLVVAVRWGGAGLARDRPDAPWGPLEVVFPLYGDDPLPYVLAAVIAAALALAFLVPPREWRRLLSRKRAATRA
jgi:hypothetical protein